MKLVGFKAKNFRCLLDTPWIPIHDLTVLIGENDGGKTATLDALSLFLSTNKGPDINDFSSLGSQVTSESSDHEGPLPQIVLEGCFQLTQEEIVQFPEQCNMDENKVTIRRKFTIETQSPFLIEAMVHPDPRFRVNLSTYTVEVLKQLASEYSIEVPSSPKNAIVEAINNWIAEQELDRMLLGKPLSLTDLVFSHPDGRPLRPNTVSRAFERLAKSLGFENIRFHDLRHAHATLMLRQGIHPKIVSERLGHSSVAITLDIYSHVLPGLQEAAARKFEEGLQDASVRIPEAGAPY